MRKLCVAYCALGPRSVGPQVPAATRRMLAKVGTVTADAVQLDVDRRRFWGLAKLVRTNLPGDAVILKPATEPEGRYFDVCQNIVRPVANSWI